MDDDKNISLLQHDALLPPENVNRKRQRSSLTCQMAICHKLSLP